MIAVSLWYQIWLIATVRSRDHSIVWRLIVMIISKKSKSNDHLNKKIRNGFWKSELKPFRIEIFFRSFEIRAGPAPFWISLQSHITTIKYHINWVGLQRVGRTHIHSKSYELWVHKVHLWLENSKMKYWLVKNLKIPLGGC